MKSVLIVTPSTEHGGAETQSLRLRDLLLNNYNAYIIQKYSIRRPIKPSVLFKLIENIRFLLKIINFLRSKDIHLVISFLPQMHPLRCL